MWNYSPHGTNLAGLPGPEEDEEGSSAQGGQGKRTYLKAVYREYTDATFKALKPRAPEWEHLGILGPVIRAEVGDTIKVYFKNNTKIFCTMHAHGLSYTKDSEGAFYNDHTSGKDRSDDAIPPGGTFTYLWSVPKSAGPGPMDPSSVLWMYHSHFVEPRELNAGLLGPIIVSAMGSTKADGTPADVDREFITAFAVFDETESSYFEANMMNKRKYSPNLSVTDPVFRKMHLFYSVNGLTDGNLTVTARRGERVRWYLLSNSNEEDVHAVHWHGQTVLFNQMRTDTISLGPMSMAVADMVPNNLGMWLLHCHVNEHLKGGMVALFQVMH